MIRTMTETQLLFEWHSFLFLVANRHLHDLYGVGLQIEFKRSYDSFQYELFSMFGREHTGPFRLPFVC